MEYEAIRDEGFDPYDPHVVAALRQVKATLAAHRHLRRGYHWWHTAPEPDVPPPSTPTFDIEHPFE